MANRYLVLLKFCYIWTRIQYLNSKVKQNWSQLPTVDHSLIVVSVWCSSEVNLLQLPAVDRSLMLSVWGSSEEPSKHQVVGAGPEEGAGDGRGDALERRRRRTSQDENPRSGVDAIKTFFLRHLERGQISPCKTYKPFQILASKPTRV